MNLFMIIYRFLHSCFRNVYQPVIHRPVVQMRDLPWLSVYAMTICNEIQTVTELVNESITYGTRVDAIYLTRVTGLRNVVSWHYFDANTLEDREFPYEGIIIGRNVDSIPSTKSD
jgi:hypothetical protein